MARLAVCVLAFLVAGGFSDPVPSHYELPQSVVVTHEDLVFQKKFLTLFFHPHEPLHLPEHQDIAQNWDLKKNVGTYNNETAVWHSVELIESNWVLPKGIPFAIFESKQKFQAVTFFNLLYSAKNLETFYKTAVYLREYINEYMFVYVTTAAIYHRQDTQGIIVPPLYEIFPSFFNNGEILTTAQRINTHGTKWVEHYPSTYLWDHNVVIRWNTTVWPFYNKETPLAYYTHDYGLNNLYYNFNLLYPSWLGHETKPLKKDGRGEYFWFLHKQLLTRYYMERLSNGLGEIPELGLDVVEQGYTSGLVYHSGIPYPVRPNYFQLQQPSFVDEIDQIVDFERRIRDAIDMGYVVRPTGERIDISQPEAIDVLGCVIEGNVDSPNPRFYKDFISIWKVLLGNSHVHENHRRGVPWVLPSALEQYQTAIRDPAFYMIWKRVLNLFTYWQEQLPLYKTEEIGFPGVEIEKVDFDKLVTYFEYTYMNVTNHLHLDEYASKQVTNTKSVVVQHPRLNHKVFNVRIQVKSEVPKNVVVRLFLAPKYDSQGNEIPLHLNTYNFFQFDQFTWTLKQGENMITHSSADNWFYRNDLTSSFEVYNNIVKALNTNEQYVHTAEPVDNYPQRLVLPKGRVGGMPFVVLVHITEAHAPNVMYGTGYNPNVSMGIGSGARRFTSDPLGYPLDRPLYQWQIRNLKNFWVNDVLIHHKQTPEVYVSHVE